MVNNPIQITSQEIFRELSAASTNWLLANAGDKIRIETTVKIQVVAISSSDTPITLNKTDGLIGAGWVYDPDNQFEHFNVGDAVIVWNYDSNTSYDAGDFTIIAKQGNGLIQLDHAVPAIADNYIVETLTVSCKSPITSLKYRYNFVKNNAGPTFISAVDGVSEQIFIIESKAANDTGSSDMRALGAYEWQEGFSDGAVPFRAKTYNFGGSAVYPVTIVGVSIDPGTTDGIYKSIYKITHYTKLPPFFLYGATIPPFLANNCLKLITKIDALRFYTDPNILQSDVQQATLGNTGWYNNNFSTGVNKYSITNLVYKDSLGAIIPSINLTTNETTIEFDIENTVDTPFTNFPTGNQYVINFHKVPADPAEYQNTGNLMDRNFLYDRLFGAVGGSANNGINYGGDYQVLKGYSFTYTSASKIHGKVGIKFAQTVIDSFNASDDAKYFISVQIRKRSLATNVGDDVTLTIDKNGFYVDTTDLTMIGFGSKNKIMRHPESDVITEGVSYPDPVNVFPEDELSAYTEFFIDSTGRTDDEIKLTSVKTTIIGIVGSNQFTIDSFSFDLSSYPFIGFVQYFDLSIADQFHIPVAEALRKYYNVKRRDDLDVGGKYYFSVQYPFLMRWETWVAALGIDPVFFDTSLPNNGFNQWWYRYGSGSYHLYYEVVVNATKNGIAQQYKSKQEFVFNDYASNTDFPVKTIKTYDLAGNELVSAGDYFINGYENTEIRAVFSNVNAPHTGADNYIAGVVEIGIEAFESGGIAGKRRFSSKWVADGDTWFTYPTGSGKVKLSSAPYSTAGHTVTAHVYLDYTQLPVGVNQFKITARIYDKTAAATWQEECITKIVSLIPANPVPRIDEITIPDNPNPGCCNDYVLTVLADDSGEPLQNDVSGVLWWFDSIVTGATLALKKWDGAAWNVVDTLSNNTCGVAYAFGFFTNIFGQNFIGYQIYWANVLDSYGTGSYRVTCTYTIPTTGDLEVNGYEYCLREYSAFNAEGTVRLEYWLNGQTGDIEDDTKVKDFGTINWYNSIRVRGFFGYPKTGYKSEDIEYNTGQSVYVEDALEEEFIMKLYLLPFFLHQLIKIDFMMADRLAVTDYNSRNNAIFIQKYVRKNSGYEPKWYHLISNLASVEVRFKPEFNRYRKLR